MRAVGQDPVQIDEIMMELDKLNLNPHSQPKEQTPKTPSSRNMEIVPQGRLETRKQKAKTLQLSPIKMADFNNEGPSNIHIEEVHQATESSNPCFGKPN